MGGNPLAYVTMLRPSGSSEPARDLRNRGGDRMGAAAGQRAPPHARAAHESEWARQQETRALRRRRQRRLPGRTVCYDPQTGNRPSPAFAVEQIARSPCGEQQNSGLALPTTRLRQSPGLFDG